MGEKTGIAWTHHSFNAWVGCSAVGEGCKFCYAERLVIDRLGKDFATRWRTSATNWKDPLRWDRAAAAAGERHRVFTLSLGDVFDNQVPDDWRVGPGGLFPLIKATPNLDWQLVTKRIGNAAKMLPADWGAGYPNVWLIATVCTQAEFDRDVPKLLATPARTYGLSIEPQLEAIDAREFLWRDVRPDEEIPGYVIGLDMPLITPRERTWIITGGESGKVVGQARPYRLAWTRSLLAQGREARAPIFVKQLGANSPDSGVLRGKGDHPEEWPADIRVQQFPAALEA